MTKKDPPVWQSDQSYEKYKKDIEVWQLLGYATANEEGPLLYGVLTGEAKDAAGELTVAEIGSEDGLKLILDKLDELYLADKNQRICNVLEAFEKFRRPGSMTMSKFLIEFEKLHSKVQGYDCSYPDGVLAYKALQAANLSAEHEKLCKATIATGEWSYQAMKDQIKKIFSDTVIDRPGVLEKAIKVEPTFYANKPSHSKKPNNEYYYERSFDENMHYSDQPMHHEDDRNSSSGEEEHDIYYGGASNRPYYKGNQYRKFNGRRPPFQQSSQFERNPNMSSNTGRKYINVNINKLKDSYNSAPHIPNPKDDRGNITTCRKCRSIYHWMQDCPHVISQENETSSKSKVYYGCDLTDDIYISLFQTSQPASSDDILCLVGETLNMAVIDSGCPITVCGEKWFSTYLESLTENERSNLQREDSHAVFRFGDSVSFTSEEKAYLPITLKDKPMHLVTEIVKADIPLLLSRETLDKGKAVADYGNKTLRIFNVEQPMICTTSGHYAIPIRAHTTPVNSNIVMHVIKDDKDLSSIAKKLHIQFGHPSAKRLIKLVKDSEEDTPELISAIEEVGNRCDTCKRYKKTSPRPVVTFPLATVFNETVGMDLKIYQNNAVYFLHLVDHATRFSAAGVIRSKKAEVIVQKIFQIWISIFGCPQVILSDNGGEFANKDFMDMCHNLNIKFITTAAEAPWSNGLVEKHNELIANAVYKITEDVRCSIEIALCWAVNAKNSLQNINGFSPYQLVFGRNPSLPSVLFDKLPALEGVTESQLIADQLNALHKARQETIKLESSEKLRRALRGKIRTHNNIRYIQGEEVFYKQEDSRRWKGPGKVIGQDGSKVLIKIPTGLISVHSSRVILTSEAELERENSQKPDNVDPEPPDATPKSLPNSHPSHDESFSSDNQSDTEIEPNPSENRVESDEEITDNTTRSVPNVRPPDVRTDDHDVTHVNDNTLGELVIDNTLGEIENTENFDHINNIANERKANIIQLPKNNQCVKYKLTTSDEWRRCRVLNRAGKVGKDGKGKYRNWVNIEDLIDNTTDCVDWENQVANWEVIDHNVLIASKSDDFNEAKRIELEKWVKMGVYEIVEDTGQPYVTVRWVLNEKMVEGEKVKKARLVARGYEDDVNGVATDSPTANKESLRIAYMIIASKGWELNSLDIRAAFLQGQPISREVYLKPPREAKMKGRLWKLKQCVYGLNDASRKFYNKVKEELLKLGCKCSKLDLAVFTYNDGDLQGMLLSHVDDFLWSGSKMFKANVIDKIRELFQISSENSSVFTYLGMKLQQCKDGIYVSQNDYTKDIPEIKINPARSQNLDVALNEEEVLDLKSAIGSLNWLAMQSRPDLSFDVCTLSTSQKDGTVGLLRQANKIIKKAKVTSDICLYFPKMKLNDLTVHCYADASLGNLTNGGSQGGLFIEIRSGNICCPIEWQSKKIRRAAVNTLAAETISLVDAISSACYIRALLAEVLSCNEDNVPVVCYTDNYSLFQTAHSTTSASDRRLRIELAFVRETIVQKEITLKWVSTGEQLADCLTKKGCDSRKLVNRITNALI